jgi:transposase
MLTRIMRHSYKDAGRGPRREKAVDSPDDDVDIEKILEENRRLKEKIERLEKENRIFRKELEMKGLEIEAVLEKNRELECRVRMDSSNSSKPPSSDGYRKPSPRSRRVKSGLKRGGQPGHRGYNMPIPHAPDEVILHYPAKCQGCPRLEECSGTRLSCNGSRYVVDVVMATKVTEHRVLGAEDCPLDDSEGAVTGRFPDSVPAYVQYGDSVAAFGGLLSTYGAVSDMRISHLMRSMFGITLSAGTVPSLVSRCASKAAPALAAIKQRLVGSEVCHFDETGARTEGRLFWVHSSSNSEYTYQTISEKRGQTGMEENGVLPGFKGTAIHDCWAPYWR